MLAGCQPSPDALLQGTTPVASERADRTKHAPHAEGQPTSRDKRPPLCQTHGGGTITCTGLAPPDCDIEPPAHHRATRPQHAAGPVAVPSLVRSASTPRPFTHKPCWHAGPTHAASTQLALSTAQLRCVRKRPDGSFEPVAFVHSRPQRQPQTPTKRALHVQRYKMVWPRCALLWSAAGMPTLRDHKTGTLREQALAKRLWRAFSIIPRGQARVALLHTLLPHP